jgi:hypothetical protein
MTLVLKEGALVSSGKGDTTWTSWFIPIFDNPSLNYNGKHFV